MERYREKFKIPVGPILNEKIMVYKTSHFYTVSFYKIKAWNDYDLKSGKILARYREVIIDDFTKNTQNYSVEV